MSSATPSSSSSSSGSSAPPPPTPTTAAPPPPTTTTTTTSTSVKRACDACHRRKVKCDGLSPCRNCSSAQLACTYNAIPQKKGPKGSRAKVISELREQNRQSALSSKAHARLLAGNAYASPPPLCAPTLAPTPGLLTNEIIAQCIDFFFVNMYPTIPILHRGKLEAQARFADRDTDTYCLLTSLCAFMLIQPGMPVPGDPMGLDSMPGANLMSGTMLMEETIRVRKGYDHLESPTLGSLATSYFLFGCYFGLDLHNKAWFHLREATTLALILGMNKEESYAQFDVIESSRRRRLYWLLFVAERSYALQRHRPLTLPSTIELPTANDDPTEHSPPLTGFIHLVTLFKPFDDKFVALWNKTRDDCSPAYLSALQKQLSDALPAYLNSTESQAAELRVNQQWLRNVVWQLGISNGCVSSGNDNPSMTFQYPVEISRDLIAMTAGFSPHSMDVHGVGLVEKLFDVAYSLTDVLSVSPPPADPFAPAPTDYLNQFLFLLSSLRNGDTRFRPLLIAKIHDILPRLVTPMLQTLPEPSSGMGPGGVDIFDGFGNAGMGVPSLPQQQQQQQYDAKPYENKQYDVKPYDVKPYDNKQYDVKPRIEDIASPVHAHPHHQQHQQQQQHAQQHTQHTPPQPALLGQEPLPPFQPEQHHQQQQPQTPAPYQAMHTPLDYAPLTDYGFLNNPRTAPQQQQQQQGQQQQRPGMGVRQGSGVFGHHTQQQGHHGLGMGQHDGGGGFEGLGLVGVAEHLQYR
ncbi:hypothetical protein V499_05963 [Pseudogymnoascus sp. VKM F-103]|uniref:Zn(2)-C6 fungal-type domain-containing protein n=1 Tax=Pseudogymnoascus verrucosus TaxID=342668 RepID=A0A1B8GVN6_9PEZI|nr:uncharacterized protein VE01_02017 [Pseudogymnoascus verrucosus]KFY73980.1 hypothetical protein V499_05963 [Pseudogymnoascus sp. VKM F-103]OBT99893.1 hypothetical protein VE01_02017 [Pseudogymnoascus verrucosus]